MSGVASHEHMLGVRTRPSVCSLCCGSNYCTKHFTTVFTSQLLCCHPINKLLKLSHGTIMTLDNIMINYQSRKENCSEELDNDSPQDGRETVSSGSTVGKMTISPWIKDFHFPHRWQYGCYMTGRVLPHGHCPSAWSPWSLNSRWVILLN